MLISPGRCGLGRCPINLKGLGFNFWSGHMPSLQFDPIQSMCKRKSIGVSHINGSLPVSPTPFPLSKVNKHVLG